MSSSLVDGSTGEHDRKCSVNIASNGFGCGEHSPQKMAMFCVDCDKPVCLRCKLTAHIHHKATTLGSAATKRCSQLKAIQQRIKCKSTGLCNSLSAHEHYQKSVSSNKVTMIEKLDKRKSHLYQVIDHWHKNLRMQVDAVFSYEMDKVTGQIELLTEELLDLREDLQLLDHVLEQALECTKASDVLVLSRDIHAEQNNKILNNKELLVGPLEELCFIFNQGKGLHYSDFGNFTTSHQQINSIGTQLISSGKLNFSFDTRHGQRTQYSATGLSLMRDGGLVVTDLGLDCVQVFRPDGQLLLELDTLPFDEPSSSVEFGESIIAVACRDDLKFFKRDGSFVQKLEQHVECPNSLHACATGELIVADHAPDGPFIHIFNSDMTLQNTIIGGSRAPCFSQPWYVTTDLTGRIIVSDRAEHNIKIFNTRGILLSEFGGQGAQEGHFFHPAGVCVDRFGHILVADSGNNRVQMFMRDGQFCVILLDNPDHELLTPMDLAVDSSGRLLVLQANGIISTYTYIY